MDSTFLGVLVRAGVEDAGNADWERTRPYDLNCRNANARNLESLENVGVLQLFRVLTGTDRLPAELALHASAPTAKPT